MQKKKTNWMFLLAAAMLVLAAGCAGTNSTPASVSGGQDGSIEQADSNQPEGDEDTIKVGILHSLSGTMAISEVSVHDAELMAIEEINAAGGVFGKQLVPVIEDGASSRRCLQRKRES